MTWNVTHHRGEILRAAADHVNEMNTGVLPMELDGVAETFADELDLIAGMYLKWHARLSGNLDDAMAPESVDPDVTVARAWEKTAQQLPGIRKLIDNYTQNPVDDRMRTALDKAQRKEWASLAFAAGITQVPGTTAEQAGRQIQEMGRGLTEVDRVTAAPKKKVVNATAVDTNFVNRIKAALVA